MSELPGVRQIATEVREGRTTAVAQLDACLSRIEAGDKSIN